MLKVPETGSRVWPSVWDDNREIENPHRIYPGWHGCPARGGGIYQHLYPGRRTQDVAGFLYDLAREFRGYHTAGSRDRSLRVLVDDEGNPSVDPAAAPGVFTNRHNGRFVEHDPPTGRKIREYSYVRGKRHGIWTTW